MRDWFIYWGGLWRAYWGSCPACNSDAPELDTCKFCLSYYGYRSKEERKNLALRWEKTPKDHRCVMFVS